MLNSIRFYETLADLGNTSRIVFEDDNRFVILKESALLLDQFVYIP